MAETPRDFRPYAGLVVFPRSPADLTSMTLCPACQSALTSATACQVCSLDLLNPVASQLSALATEAVAVFDRRLDLIGRIRWESSQAALAARAFATAPATVTVTVTTVAPESSVPAPTPIPAPVPAPLPAQTEPRHSGVQVALLVIGISLLSVAAIFFLVYAFITFGLIARTLIVGAITVASVITASGLRQRGLAATAEGIAAFAIVLVFLDTWAVRANNFFSPSAFSHNTFSHNTDDGVHYWGWALVILGLLLVGWSRLSKLHAPAIVGFAVFPVGFGLLVGSLAAPDDILFVTFAAIALAGIAQRFAVDPTLPGRVVSFVVTMSALVAAFGASFGVVPTAHAGTTVALLVLAMIAAAHVVIVDRHRSNLAQDNILGAILAATAAALASGAVAAAALRVHDTTFSLLAPPLAAAIIALSLDAALSRSRSQQITLHLRAAAIAAGGIAAMTLLFPIATLINAMLGAVTRGLTDAWSVGGGSSITSSSITSSSAELLAAAGALAIVVALITGSWALQRRLLSRQRVVSWAIVGCALVVPVAAHILWVVVLIWLLVAALALTALLRLPHLRLPHRHRTPLAVVTFGSAGLAYAVAWASLDTWAVSGIAVIIVMLVARVIFTLTMARSALLASALIVAIIGAGATARNLALPLHPGALADAINTARATGFVAILLLAIAALVPLARVTRRDRQVAFWIALATVAASILLTQFSLYSLPHSMMTGLLLPEYQTGLVVGAFLLIALAAWLWGGFVRSLRVERTTIAVFIAPALAFAIDSLVRVLMITPNPPQLASVLAATIAAAISLVLVTSRTAFISRSALEIGLAVVAVLALGGAIAVPGPLTWLVFEIAAVGAGLVALGSPDPFRSSGRRRSVGWLAIAVATCGLWWFLASDQVTAVEAWVLPLSGLLLLVAVVAWASGRKRPESSAAAPLITFAALVISLVPLAVQPSIGTELRPLTVGLVSASLLIAGVTPVMRGHARHFLWLAAGAGWIGLVLVTVVQTATIIQNSLSDARLDLWIAGGFIVPIVAARLLVRAHRSSRLPVLAAEALVATAIVELVALELVSLAAYDRSFLRAGIVVIILCATHLVALVARHTPFTARIGWASIALAALVGAVAISTGAVDDVEWVSVPLALALLVSGATQLRWVATSGSWPWLAPGIGVLLIPSLVSTAWEPALWRLVALGVASVILVITGVLLKLQSPLVLAGIVALLHAIATFSPQIAAVYQAAEWWVWLAVGGVLIVIISVRFERSRQGVVRVVRSIAELR